MCCESWWRVCGSFVVGFEMIRVEVVDDTAGSFICDYGQLCCIAHHGLVSCCTGRE